MGCTGTLSPWATVPAAPGMTGGPSAHNLAKAGLGERVAQASSTQGPRRSTQGPHQPSISTSASVSLYGQGARGP